MSKFPGRITYYTFRKDGILEVHIDIKGKEYTYEIPNHGSHLPCVNVDNKTLNPRNVGKFMSDISKYEKSESLDSLGEVPKTVIKTKDKKMTKAKKLIEMLEGKIKEKYAFDVKGGEQEVKGLLKDIISVKKRLETLEKIGVDVFGLKNINTTISRNGYYILKKFKKTFDSLLSSDVSSDKLPKKLTEGKKAKVGELSFDIKNGGFDAYSVTGTLEYKGKKYKGSMSYNDEAGMDFSFTPALPDEVTEMDDFSNLGWEAAAKA